LSRSEGNSLYLRQAGYYCTNSVKEHCNFETPDAGWDESSNNAHWHEGPPGQPFFSILNMTMTHQGQVRYSREKLEALRSHRRRRGPLERRVRAASAARANRGGTEPEPSKL